MVAAFNIGGILMSISLTVEFSGKEIELNGKKYILPTLGLGAYSDHDAFKKIQAVMKVFKPFFQGGQNNQDSILQFLFENEIPSEVFGYVGELIFMALQRNYPDLKYEDVRDKIDLIQSFTFIPYVITQDGKGKALKNAGRQPEVQAQTK